MNRFDSEKWNNTVLILLKRRVCCLVNSLHLQHNTMIADYL